MRLYCISFVVVVAARARGAAARVKGQLSAECLFDFLNFPKNQRKIRQISAPESKKWSNQQSKGTFL